jgi:hypothetical protein
MPRYYYQNQSLHNNRGNQLMRGALRHNDVESQGILSLAEKVEAWLEIVALYTKNGESMDPSTAVEVPSDAWAGPATRCSDI